MRRVRRAGADEFLNCDSGCRADDGAERGSTGDGGGNGDDGKCECGARVGFVHGLLGVSPTNRCGA